MLMRIDLCIAVHQQIPILLEKLSLVPTLITGKCNVYCQSWLTEFHFRFSSNSSSENFMSAVR